jgi:uncharacterized protein Yka (UPF0111/DUF47 family)
MIDGIKTMHTGSRQYFDDQILAQKSAIGATDNKLDTFSRTVVRLQGEMKERDEALKKIPPNVQELLKKMKEEVVASNKETKKLTGLLEDKVSNAQLKKLMKKKLDVDSY